MLQFEKNGKIVMTEKDNGEIKITEEAPNDWKIPKKPMPGGPKENEQPAGEEGSTD